MSNTQGKMKKRLSMSCGVTRASQDGPPTGLIWQVWSHPEACGNHLATIHNFTLAHLVAQSLGCKILDETGRAS